MGGADKHLCIGGKDRAWRLRMHAPVEAMTTGPRSIFSAQARLFIHAWGWRSVAPILDFSPVGFV
jgi:hypothetical protein